MATLRAVVNTDQVNKQNIRVPVKALVNSVERHVAFSLEHKLPLGSPSFISHDLTRLAGWSSSPLTVLCRDMARQVAFIHYPEIQADEQALREISDAYSKSRSEQQRAGFEQELRGRVNQANLGDATADFSHCAILIRNGLVSELYPEFFSLDSAAVDKDGLTYYDELTSAFDVVQPGIFHDRERNVLIFAHKFFRRSLSNSNSLNQYFLKRFDDAAKGKNVRARIRLDPDMVGHPESLEHVLEFEYWHGPKFSDDIQSIPSGATVHSADEQTRFFESIGKTHLWWKHPETRIINDKEFSYRTFEAEELLEEPSAGLGKDDYGCRYVHAEYAVEAEFISHFDGAIRAYPAIAFVERIEKNIDRAGKHSTYTKIFRLDGDVPVHLWKSLTVDFFRGNRLLPEYFGAPEEVPDAAPSASESGEAPELVALISFHGPETCPLLRVVADQSCPHDGELIDCIDFNSGACGQLISQLVDISSASLLLCQDKIINMPRIIIGVSDNYAFKVSDLSRKLADALSSDRAAGKLEQASIALSWTGHGAMTTVSLAGKIDALIALIRCVPDIIEPGKPAAIWVDSLNAKLKELAPIQLGG
ncbi:MAG: hypothetical protein ABR987_20850, partial [Terracidiphilus sp.]